MEKQRVMPFLTFTGRAEEAMQFYSSSLPDMEITKLVRHGTEHPYADEGEEDLVLHGAVSVMGQGIIFLDMTAAHPAPDFSRAISIYLDCRDESEFDAVFNGLAQGGVIMMGPEYVAQSRKCAWVTDKFGVTWQPVWN